MDWLSRLELLIDNDNINKINETTICIIGIGGVGGYALETLVRSGIGKVIVIDNDKIDITNLNRQLIATNSVVNEYKVDVFCNRIKDINLNIEVIKIKEFITKDNINILDNYKIDYVVDACDTIETKKEIIRYTLYNDIKLISSMGTGNKLDPTKFKIVDIRKTSYDPIAKIIRKMIKDEKIKQKIMVVCSDEIKVRKNSKTIPSNAFVPATAGLLCTSYIINDIIKK